MKRSISGHGAGLILPILFLAAAFAAPLAFVAARVIGTSRGAADILTSPYFRGVVVFTMKQALLSTLFSVLFGLPGAYFVGRCRFPGRNFLKSLSTVPFVLPPVLAVLGFILVFGNSGALNNLRHFLSGGTAEPWKILYSLKAVIMAHVFYNFPITLRLVGDAWGSLPQTTVRAARASGAKPIRCFLTVDLPMLVPTIATAAIVTFLYCFLSFAIVLVLGGGPELTTLEVEVYRLVKYKLDFDGGSAVAAVETLIASCLLLAYGFASSRMSRAVREDASGRIPRPPMTLRGAKGLIAVIYIIPAVLLIIAPTSAIVVNSFLSRNSWAGGFGLSLVNWKRLFSGTGPGAAVPIAAVGRSFILGCAVSLLSVTTAASAARYAAARDGKAARFLGMAMAAPIGVSSIILGLGYLLALNILPKSGFARKTALLCAQVTLALPVTYRILLTRFRSISPRILMAAETCGASRLRRFFTVELPMAKRALLTAGVFSFAISAGELNAAVILAPSRFTTIPVAIYQMIGAYDLQGACALGTLLIVLCTGAFLAFDRFGETGL